MKWENIEPEPNSFDFGPADEIVHFAESVNAKMRGHNFMWYVSFLRISKAFRPSSRYMQGQPATAMGEFVIDSDGARQSVGKPYYDRNGPLPGEDIRLGCYRKQPVGDRRWRHCLP